MKKILVIGCPGSGKSTFSRALNLNTGIPVYHLDMMFWNADKTTVCRETFLERLNDVMKRDEWIIDGNYASTMELRLSKCDTVFFLDYASEVCLEGVRARRGAIRSDMPWIETEDDAEFLSFVSRYNEDQRPSVLKLLEKYGDKKVFIFKSRQEAEEFLKENV